MMQPAERLNEELNVQGFAIAEGVYDSKTVHELLEAIRRADSSASTFRRSADLFAIRQFFIEIPDAFPLVFSNALRRLLKQVGADDYTIVKSIYFDKPEQSNWFVAWHQDLTISVKDRTEVPGYGPWTVKQNQYAVQPPVALLEDNLTLRIHLDDTDATNGALKVVPGSHRKGIYRPETINWDAEQEVICEVEKGSVMLMKPLLLHASGRSTTNRRRRVIHVELSRATLPSGLQWGEALRPA